MGGALALALAACGQSVDRLIYRRRGRIASLAEQISPRPEIISIDKLKGVGSEVLIIATQDEQIAEVSSRLVDRFTGKAVFHTSGSMSSAVLAAFAQKGKEVASLHPLASITKWSDGLDRFRGAYFCLEGTEKAIRIGKRLVNALGGRSFVVSSTDKGLYHAAAVTAAGHVTALFDVAVSIMVKSGLSRADARKVLWPLLHGVAANLEKQDTPAALTGTYSRGELGTVRRHLEALNRSASQNEFDIYLNLALRSIDLSEAAGLDHALAQKMRKTLGMAKASRR